MEVGIVGFWSAQDVGKAIHPVLVEGQLEGGSLQALGFALVEEMKFEDGRLLSNRMTNCIIPTALDAPEMEAFWAKIAELGLVLCLELSSGPSYDVAGYMAHVTAFGRVLARHRDLRVHLAMSPPVAYFARNGRYEFPEELLRVYRHEPLVLRPPPLSLSSSLFSISTISALFIRIF